MQHAIAHPAAIVLIAGHRKVARGDTMHDHPKPKRRKVVISKRPEDYKRQHKVRRVKRSCELDEMYDDNFMNDFEDD